MLLQVWVRGRRNLLGRARSPRRARDVSVNGPPKSGPILAGTRLCYATRRRRLLYPVISVRQETFSVRNLRHGHNLSSD
jgi:hypothetical protein